MKSTVRHLVYYTLFLTKEGRSYGHLLEQHIGSVESLRRSNRSIPICLTVCGRKLLAKDQRHLKDLRVRVRHVGSYEDRLRRSGFSILADVFAENPNSPKWISFPEILRTRFDDVLFIDNDTFLLDDVEALFAALGNADVCAREEPWTKRSHLGYDPAYLDQSALRSLQRSEKLNPIHPFNTGVVLMKRTVAEWFSRNLDLFLSYLTRFAIWMAEQRRRRDDQAFVIIARELGLEEASTGLKPLLYPCSNQWIVGQLAFWFTLAAKRFQIRILSPSLVLQGAEFLGVGRKFQAPTLIHYYTANLDYFRRWRRRFENAGKGLEGRAK